jgi:hypothetical protein
VIPAPVETVFGPVVITPSGPWLVLELGCRSYEGEPERDKQALVDELTGWAVAAAADFQLLRVERAWDPRAYVEHLRRHMPERARPHRHLYRELLDRQQAALERMAPSNPVVFLCVRLADVQTDAYLKAKQLFNHSPRELVDRARGALRMRRAESLDPVWLSEIYERVQATADRAFAHLDCELARADQIQWLIYRSFCRGLGEPFIPGLGEPQAVSPAYGFEPTVVPEQGNVLRWLLEHGVERHSRHLRVSSELGDSYQAGVCVGEIRRHAEAFSRHVELMFSAVDDLPFAVDCSLSVTWVANEIARRRWERVIAKSREQAREEDEQTEGDAKDQSVRRVALAHEAHARLERTEEPHLEGTLSLMLAAPSLQALADRVERVQKSFPWATHRPHGDQHELFLDHFPGQQSRVVGYQRVWMCDQVGAMVPQAARQAGAKTRFGIYFARSFRGRHPILVDLREGSDSAKSTLIVLLGSLGGGKTLALQYLEYLAFVLGGRIVDVDPKGDHRAHRLPQVQGHVQEIVIGPEPEHKGKLDPLRVAPADERQEATVTFLKEILGPELRFESEITWAVADVIRRSETEDRPELACCMEVVRTLRDSEQEAKRQAGYHLGNYCDAGLARLGFASVEDPLPSAGEQWTYLNIRALKRAQTRTTRSEMTTGERHGRAILQLISLYAMRILGTERDRLKVLGFDEASFISADAVGEQLLDQLERWGRSELALPVISTQLTGDVSGKENLIGQAILFAMQHESEARTALALVGLDPDDERLVQNLTKHYGAGRGLYRDLHGRHEEIQVNLKEVDPELFSALKTDPVAEETFDDREAGSEDELAA